MSMGWKKALIGLVICSSAWAEEAPFMTSGMLLVAGRMHVRIKTGQIPASKDNVLSAMTYTFYAAGVIDSLRFATPPTKESKEMAACVSRLGMQKLLDFIPQITDEDSIKRFDESGVPASFALLTTAFGVCKGTRSGSM